MPEPSDPHGSRVEPVPDPQLSAQEIPVKGSAVAAEGAERLAQARPSSEEGQAKAKVGSKEDEEPRRPLRRRVLSWCWQGALAVAVYLLISSFQTRGLAHGAAPDFRLRDLEGREVALDDLQGKRVMLHFWATWCGVCRVEFPLMNSLAGASSADQVVVSVVADSEDPEKVAQFVRDHDLRYPVLLADEQVLRDYAVKAFPTTYFLNSKGEITAGTVGMTTRLGAWVRLALAR